MLAERTNPRTELLDSFLHPSHGDLKSLTELHRTAAHQDPILYPSLGRWYQSHGSLRDHHELFVAHSLTSSFPEHRENGLVLLQTLRPYQVARVVRYVKETLRFPTRILKSAVRFYLRRREQNAAWFDECCIRDRTSMKYLYATLRIKPSERAELILFADRPPADSRMQVCRRLFSLRDKPDEQARLISTHRIQFMTARGAISNYTPEVLKALTGVMTPPQLITNLSFLEKRGVLSHPELRQVVEQKLRRAVTESRVCEFKALVALKRISADPKLADQILAMIGERLRGRGRITVPTAILVDKSGSMQECIEVGKLLAVLCGTIADAPLYVEAFDSHSFTVDPVTRDFAGWEAAFRRIQAAGATSVGAPLRKLRERPLEQILLISDGEENTQPFFAAEVLAYQRAHGRDLHVVWIKVGQTSQTFENTLNTFDVDIIRFRGDYYNLPNVIPLLCPGNHASLVDEVLAVPPYTRQDLENLPSGFDPETYEVL
ncbi:MAG: hypothetical protein AB1758_29500 [Candidatus Eremiobacterota bacterium]